jgi:SAM-dependent methyltransferase
VSIAAGKPAAVGDFILDRRARLVRPWLADGGGVLLDFGCGNGAQTVRLMDPFRRIIGADINARSLDAFMDHAARNGGGGRCESLLLDARRIDLPDDSVDCLTSFEVLEHVVDEAATLAEWRRVLRPGGRLVITVPNRWWIFETHGADLPYLPWNRVPLFSWLPKRVHDRWARARIYRRREIVAKLTRAGFQVHRTAYVTAPMDVVRWEPLRRVLRSTVFRSDTTGMPMLATAIVVWAD